MYINIILFSIVFPRIAPIPTLSPLFPVSVLMPYRHASFCFLLQYMGGGPEPPLPLGAQGDPLVMNGKREFK